MWTAENSQMALVIYFLELSLQNVQSHMEAFNDFLQSRKLLRSDVLLSHTDSIGDEFKALLRIVIPLPPQSRTL